MFTFFKTNSLLCFTEKQNAGIDLHMIFRLVVKNCGN